jgi:hypothetical protein
MQAGLFSPRGTDGLKTSRPRAVRRLALGLVLVVCGLMGVSAGPATAWELPEGRVYEMVTPPYKADYPVSAGAKLGTSADGERVVFVSIGAFAGARSNWLGVHYLARRTAGGWATSATEPPAAAGRFSLLSTDYSPDLCAQVTGTFPPTGEEAVGGSALVLSDLCPAGEESFTQAWPLPDGPATFPGCERSSCIAWGASGDLSHVLFGSAGGGIYALVGVGGPEPREEEVAVVGRPEGPGGSILTPCPSGEPVAKLNGGSPHAISETGSEIFFSHCGVSDVRVNDSSTFELSASRPSPSALSGFLSASADGSKAFVSGPNNQLLMDVIDSEPGSEALAEVVPITPAGLAGGFVVSSDDGSHVYFSASSVLSGANPSTGDSPQAGADNLYVYDTVTRTTAFVAIAPVDVLAGHGAEGPEAQTTPDGRFLVFATPARLTADDADTAADVYRYDAETGALVRVSAGEEGHDDNGNNNAFPATIAATPDEAGVAASTALATWRLGARAISDDGGTIVFSTREPLSSRAVNKKLDVYVWHEGRVWLISTGLSQTDDENPVVSQTGRDVFFETTQSILPQDSDGLLDIYDARIGGGFPVPPVSAGGCSGDTCQGPPSVPSLLGAPASATFSGLGNPVAAPAHEPRPLGKPKPKPKACRKLRVKGKVRCVKAKKSNTARRSGRARGARS